MDIKCPGTDSRFLKIGIYKCGNCGYEVEMFSDELRVKCPKCGSDVFQETTPSCIEWCKSARECLGEEKWQEIKKIMDEKKERTDFKEKILLEMKKYFGLDDKRILHAQKVLQYAEQILKEEKGNRNVVIPAAILHDIGIRECERKYNSTDGHLQEKEGPPIAKKILENLKIKPKIIAEVGQIIAHHHTQGKINTLNFKILWDADWLVNLRDEYDLKDKEKLQKIIEKVFLTPTGKRLADEIYLK